MLDGAADPPSHPPTTTYAGSQADPFLSPLPGLPSSFFRRYISSQHTSSMFFYIHRSSSPHEEVQRMQPDCCPSIDSTVVMAAKIVVRSGTPVALLVAAALWMYCSCALLPAAMAADTAAQPASLPTAAATGVPPPTVDSPAAVPTDTAVTAAPAAAAALLPSSSEPATPAASSATAAATAADTAPEKIPLPNHPDGEPHPGVGQPYTYNPAAEVASALPVPTPDELPSAASLGFDGHGLGYGGPGDACCGGGGYGWFGGPGGYGPGTYGYAGPLYWGAAPAGGWGSAAAANVVVPLLVACVSAAMLA